jgi:predicted RNase H-like HicB family nuclease
MQSIKIIVERHEDGYVAYPVGMRGIVVGEGGSYDEALADVRSAIRFHVETFGRDALLDESPVLDAYVTDTEVPV